MAPSNLLISQTWIINSYLRDYLYSLWDTNVIAIQVSPITMKLLIFLWLILGIFNNRCMTAQAKDCGENGRSLGNVCACKKNWAGPKRENNCYVMMTEQNINFLLTLDSCTINCNWNFGEDYHNVLSCVNSANPLCKWLLPGLFDAFNQETKMDTNWNLPGSSVIIQT
jgi:hypothetical protein